MSDKIFFVGDHLEHNGIRVDLSAEQIIKTSLQTPTASIVAMVTNAVEILTEFDCSSFNIRRSSLFNEIEKKILQNETYLDRKKEVSENQRAEREKLKQEKLDAQRGTPVPFKYRHNKK